MNKYHQLYKRDSRGRYISGVVTSLADRFYDKIDKVSHRGGC